VQNPVSAVRAVAQTEVLPGLAANDRAGEFSGFAVVILQRWAGVVLLVSKSLDFQFRLSAGFSAAIVTRSVSEVAQRVGLVYASGFYGAIRAALSGGFNEPRWSGIVYIYIVYRQACAKVSFCARGQWRQ
jgi:hypothetical protein